MKKNVTQQTQNIGAMAPEIRTSEVAESYPVRDAQHRMTALKVEEVHMMNACAIPTREEEPENTLLSHTDEEDEEDEEEPENTLLSHTDEEDEEEPEPEPEPELCGEFYAHTLDYV